MKAQLDYLTDQVTGADPNDPISQALVNQFPQRANDMLTRLNQKIGNSINAVTDPFTVINGKLEGWEPHVTGIWGEWSVIKQYYSEHKLVDYSVNLQPRGAGEVDVIIKENNVEKWVEVKNVETPKNAWSKAVGQIENYITQGYNGEHPKDVIIELPQQDPKNPVSSQQLNYLKTKLANYPGVHFEVRGMQDPPIPFEPPIGNWGNFIP